MANRRSKWFLTTKHRYSELFEVSWILHVLIEKHLDCVNLIPALGFRKWWRGKKITIVYAKLGLFECFSQLPRQQAMLHLDATLKQSVGSKSRISNAKSFSSPHKIKLNNSVMDLKCVCPFKRTPNALVHYVPRKYWLIFSYSVMVIVKWERQGTHVR